MLWAQYFSSLSSQPPYLTGATATPGPERTSSATKPQDVFALDHADLRLRGGLAVPEQPAPGGSPPQLLGLRPGRRPAPGEVQGGWGDRDPQEPGERRIPWPVRQR